MSTNRNLDRRAFCKLGGAAALGLAAAGCSRGPEVATQADPAAAAEAAAFSPAAGRIASYRKLGRTGFLVSDVSMGCGSIAESNVVRYAYDHGINLFDTAESYGNGDSETKIGQAMPHLDRSKVFIVTKVSTDDHPDEQTIVDRFQQCLARLATPYADALFLYAIADATMIDYAPYHQAVARLKADGKLRFSGISSHGPNDDEGDAMDTVLVKAAADGRFDAMLLTYGFLNQEQGERVLAACREKNVGTMIMKAATGLIEIPTLDPDHPSEELQGWLDSLMERGNTREQAIERIRSYLERQRPQFEDSVERTRPFMAKHGVKNQDELNFKSYQWVLNNPDAHTLCVSLASFDLIDRYLPLSGTRLSAAGAEFLEEYARAFGHRECRIGCTACRDACPAKLSVSTIMRYAYYYRNQGRQKYALRSYAGLGARNASVCLDCSAPCVAACPRGVQVQARLFEAHGLLSLA